MSDTSGFSSELVGVSGATSSGEVTPSSDRSLSARTGRPKKGYLEAGYRKHYLIADLAQDELTYQQLGEKYGCTRQAIGAFARRHAHEILSKRQAAADEYHGVWVASKLDRLRTIQAAAEDMAAGVGSTRHAEVLSKLLKDAAEELGDLPARAQVQVQNNIVTTEVVGISTEDLM